MALYGELDTTSSLHSNYVTCSLFTIIILHFKALVYNLQILQKTYNIRVYCELGKIEIECKKIYFSCHNLVTSHSWLVCMSYFRHLQLCIHLSWLNKFAARTKCIISCPFSVAYPRKRMSNSRRFILEGCIGCKQEKRNEKVEKNTFNSGKS